MGEVWTNRELAGKNALLDDKSPLRKNAQVVLRCAECILARPTTPGQEPSFTATEIERCTGFSQQIVSFSLGKVIDSGFLDKTEAPPTLLCGNKRPAFYTPKIRNETDEFFIPQPRPGCDRTSAINTLETLTVTQRDALACLGHLARLKTEGPLTETTSPAVQLCTGSDLKVVRQVFKAFQHSEVLVNTDPKKHGNERHALRHELTDYGVSLARDLEPLNNCFYGQNYSTERQDRDKLKPVTVQAIHELYPPEAHDRIVARVTRLMDMSILRQNLAGRAAEKGSILRFDSRAFEIIGKTGCQAVASWLDLDPMIYGRRLHEHYIRHILALTKDEDIGTHVKKRFFEPLVEKLTLDKD